jgi:1,4-dihydroxy-2-naphthoate octaprenyltransferase
LAEQVQETVVRAAEPTLERLANPLRRYVLATRPAFLSVTLVGCLVGLGTSHYSGIPHHPLLALVTIVLALLAHGGINMFNDYYDALNGTDAINTGRIFPYTGGSRFIQNGVLTIRQTLLLAALLFALVILAGIWLMAETGAGLLVIGVLGLFIGWAYSARPFSLNSRGFGELCVTAGFLLIVVGADFVQRRAFSSLPVVAGLPYALLVTNLLYINQFPDREADATAGKRHWVVRLGPRLGRWGYLLVALTAYGGLVAAVVAGTLPVAALVALLSAFWAARASRALWLNAEQPRKLTPAIQATIAAALVHGIILAIALWWSNPTI